MFISFFTGKVMLFYGISLIMKEKSNASALAPRFGRVCSLMRMRLLPRSLPSLRIGLRELGERGRECGWRLKCLLRLRGPHFASKVSYRAGAAGWRSFPFSLIYINESAQSLAEDWAEILSEVSFRELSVDGNFCKSHWFASVDHARGLKADVARDDGGEEKRL